MGEIAGGGAGVATLELRLVGDIEGRFFVPRYQRGYRWGAHEVGQLLEDIRESKGADYSLQPVVVKRRSGGELELVDGQQRLTTLYLIFLFMKREGVGPTYSIAYETRLESQDYLEHLDPARERENIDFWHLSKAYQSIASWFGKFGHRRQHEADELYGALFKSVRVIWYEAPPEVDSTTLFTRLNAGRIPLTDAELFKALIQLPDPCPRPRGAVGRHRTRPT